MTTYGGDTYAGTGPLASESVFIYVSVRLTAFGALKHEERPRAHLTAEGTLESQQPTFNRSGGSTATVQAAPFGLGTKVLAGATARVLVRTSSGGTRIPLYTEHPNTRQDTNYVPRGEAALAAFPRDEAREPRSGEGRQLVLLGVAPGSTESEDENIFDVDHRA